MEEKKGIIQSIAGFISGQSSANVDVNASIDEDSLAYMLVGTLFVGIFLILFSVMLRKMFKV